MSELMIKPPLERSKIELEIILRWEDDGGQIFERRQPNKPVIYGYGSGTCKTNDECQRNTNSRLGKDVTSSTLATV